MPAQSRAHRAIWPSAVPRPTPPPHPATPLGGGPLLVVGFSWSRGGGGDGTPCSCSEPSRLQARLPLGKHFRFLFVYFPLLNQRCSGGLFCFPSLWFSVAAKARGVIGEGPRSTACGGGCPLPGRLPPLFPNEVVGPGCRKSYTQKGGRGLVSTVNIIPFN